MTNDTNAGSVIIGAKGSQKNKMEVNLDQIKPGMMTAETVFNNLGAIIINSETVLTASMIKTLNRLGLEKVKVYSLQEDQNTDPVKIFKNRYLNNISTVVETLNDLYSGKQLDIEKVDRVVDFVIDKINNEKLINEMSFSYILSEYEYTHSMNVSILSALIGKCINFSESDLKSIARSGLLHDIGKVRVDKAIIQKMGSLTLDEYEEAKKHVDYGIEIIKDIGEITYDEGMGILKHHEREDGSGYIYGLKGKNIHEFAKIIAVADVFDAMNSNKPYSKKLPVFEIFDQLETGIAGSLDKNIVDIFLKNAAKCFVGEKFFMSNGKIGEVVFINEKRLARPLIKVEGGFLDLSKEDSVNLGELL